MQSPISSPQARGPFRRLNTRLILLFSSTARGTGRSCHSLQLQRESNTAALLRAPDLMKETVDNYWPGEGIIAPGLPPSRTLVPLHSYIPVPAHTHLLQEGEEWNGPLGEDALQLSAAPGPPRLYLFNPNPCGIYKYNCCLQKLCFTPGEE